MFRKKASAARTDATVLIGAFFLCLLGSLLLARLDSATSSNMDHRGSRIGRLKTSYASAGPGSNEPAELTTDEYKVSLVLLTESGCPYSYYAIVGPVNELINTPGIADIISLRQFSFGNNYYGTRHCGGGGTNTYSSDVRQCWAANCIDTADPLDECFDGPIVPQHGPTEIEFNKLQACAAYLAGYNNWYPHYWPFLVCTEDRHFDGATYRTTDTPVLEVAKICSEESDYYEYEALLECYTSKKGDEVLQDMARQTFSHSAVPYAVVTGQQYDIGAIPFNVSKDTATLVNAVCTAYNGPNKPEVCRNLTTTIISSKE